METALLDLPHSEARRLVQTGAAVYLTVNPVEFHGPHLSLHNDRLVSLGIARQLHQELRQRGHDWPFLLGSDLEVGVEPCPGPGSRHASLATVRRLVLEACRSLVELGTKRVILMTFHGAPLHGLAIQAGVDWLTAQGVVAVAPFNLILAEMLRLDSTASYQDALSPIADPAQRQLVADELRFDFHAGFFETSVALHYAPQSVAPLYRELPPCPPVPAIRTLAGASRLARWLGKETLARELQFAAVGLAWSDLRPFPGYTGRPHLASAASGGAFARRIGELFTPAVEAVLSGRENSPPPIMEWVGWLSLGGRIGSVQRR